MNLIRPMIFNCYVLLLLAILFVGCSDDEQAIPAGELKIELSKTNITAGESIVFTDNSTEAESRIWIFEGGSPATSTEKSVTVNFGEAGSFSTRVDVAFLDGTTKTQDFTIIVSAAAKVYEVSASVDKEAASAGQPVVFTDNSEDVKSRVWNFPGGDPESSTEKEAIVTYAAAGQYNATLEVTFEDGSKISQSFHITVTQAYEERVAVTGETYVVYSESPTFRQASEFKWASTKKWDWTFADPALWGDSYSFGDQVYLRLADTYLLMAEAQLKANGPDAALPYINAVRERSNATPATSAQIDLDYILDERSRELVTEEYRRETLVRTGTFYERTLKYNPLAAENIQPYHKWYPIPQAEIDATGMQQNQWQ